MRISRLVFQFQIEKLTRIDCVPVCSSTSLLSLAVIFALMIFIKLKKKKQVASFSFCRQRRHAYIILYIYIVRVWKWQFISTVAPAKIENHFMSGCNSVCPCSRVHFFSFPLCKFNGQKKNHERRSIRIQSGYKYNAISVNHYFNDARLVSFYNFYFLRDLIDVILSWHPFSLVCFFFWTMHAYDEYSYLFHSLCVFNTVTSFVTNLHLCNDSQRTPNMQRASCLLIYFFFFLNSSEARLSTIL